MRQFLKISLLLIYVFFNAGISYSMHYCGEELKEINWLAESDSCCPDEKGGDDCCEDVPYSEIQSSDQHSKQLADFQFVKSGPGAVPAPLQTYCLSYLVGQAESLPFFYQQHLPPPFPVYIKNQVFLI